MGAEVVQAYILVGAVGAGVRVAGADGSDLEAEAIGRRQNEHANRTRPANDGVITGSWLLASRRARRTVCTKGNSGSLMPGKRSPSLSMRFTSMLWKPSSLRNLANT